MYISLGGIDSISVFFRLFARNLRFEEEGLKEVVILGLFFLKVTWFFKG